MAKTITIDIEDLNSRQIEIYNKIMNSNDTKYNIIRASRQSGKTFLIERLAFIFAISEPNCKVAYVNGQHSQNTKVYAEMLSFIPTPLVSSHSNGQGYKEINLINGSQILFWSAKSYNAVAGSSFDHMICDEFALWPIGAWSIIQPVVNAKPNAKVIIASTPRGKNQFWDAIQLTKTYHPFYVEHRMMYTDNENYDMREVEVAKNSYTELAWKQEYLAEFVFGKGIVFGEFAHLQKINNWIEPEPNRKYYFGLDIAGEGDDETVLTIVDDLGRVALIYEAKNDNIPLQSGELTSIIKKYNAIGYGEKNGLGVGLVESIQTNGINIHKWNASNSSKQENVSNMLNLISKAQLQLPTPVLCPKLDNEMTTYEVKRTASGNLAYSHPQGLHDDYVDSLMLAYYAFKKFHNNPGLLVDTSDIKDYSLPSEDYTDLY